jgi:NodT family efflux transporter outer membrane factor (OMF) lipoprotein
MLAVPLLLALAGCATPGDSAPYGHLAEAAPLAAQLSHGQAPWPQERWWTALGDAQLDRLIDTALAEAPSLQVAEARLRQAQAQADAYGAARLPNAEIGLDVTRQRYTETGAIPPPLAGSTRTSGRLAVDFTYDLDFWNRNRSLFESALSQRQAAAAEQQGARLILAAALARSWAGLERLHSLDDVAREQQAQRQRLLELQQRLLAAGLVAESEVALAESQAAAARQEVQAVAEQLTLQRHTIAALAGQGPDFAATLGRPAITAAESDLPDVLPADLLGRRPDLAAARWRVEAARGGSAAAKAEFYPNVNLLAFIGYSSIGLSNLLKSASGIAGLGPAISLPLFDGGRRRANLEGAHAEEDLALAQYNQILVEAVRDVADQAASQRSLAAQARDSAQALSQSSRAYDLARRRFAAGLASEGAALSAESPWLERRRAAADLRERQLAARIGLIKALGGGYSATLPPNAGTAATAATQTNNNAQPQQTALRSNQQ